MCSLRLLHLYVPIIVKGTYRGCAHIEEHSHSLAYTHKRQTQQSHTHSIPRIHVYNTTHKCFLHRRGHLTFALIINQGIGWKGGIFHLFSLLPAIFSFSFWDTGRPNFFRGRHCVQLCVRFYCSLLSVHVGSGRQRVRDQLQAKQYTYKS